VSIIVDAGQTYSTVVDMTTGKLIASNKRMKIPMPAPR